MRPGINAHHLTTDDLANRAPVLPRIARLLKPYRGKIVLVLIAVVLAAGLTTLLPFLTRAVFDHALFPVNGSKPHLHLLVWLVVGMCVIPVVASLISIGQNWLTSTIGNSAMADLRGDLFEHLQTMELAFFTATKTGAIQSRLANDVAGVRTVLTDTATTIVQNTVVVSAAFVSMVVLSWQLTALTLMMLPLFLVLQAGVGRRRQRLARRTQESLSEMTAITEEALSVSGILLAKVFNRHDAEVQRYREANRRQTRLQVEQAMTGRTFFAVVQTTFAITPAILYLASGWLITGQAPVAGEALTAGTLVAFTTLQARLQMPLLQLMRVTLDVQTSLALFRRIFEYVDLDPAIKDRPGAVHLPASEVRGRVELDRVWFRYPEPRKLSGSAPTERFPASLGEAATATADPAVPAPTVPDEPMAAEVTPAEPTGTGRHRADVEPDAGWALQDVSLVVEPGQLAAIVGPSGSGKTTTTYLIPRFFDVTRGAVRIDGHDVRDLTLASLADIVGMVTQEPYLFHGTIRENLAYAKPDATTEEIERAARDANIHERIIGFPLGYETITGERGYRLSGGEKQRLAIARVLLKDPPILILDEATSSLDNETERLVQEALERATRSRTTIAIAHRLSTIRSSDVIFGLVDGTVVERGTHDDLLTDPGGIYSRLWQEQLRARR